MREKVTTYSLVICLVGLAFLIGFSFFSFIGKEAIVLLFLPAIVGSVWYGGLQAGFFATVLSSFLIVYFFFPQFHLSKVSALTQIYLFFAEGFGLSLLISTLKQATFITKWKKREKEQTKRILVLEKQYALAKEEIRARDEFLSIASHELKTPLTSMLLQVQTALHSIRSVSLAKFSVESLLKMLEGTERQTSRLSKMINDLLNVSLITTRKLDLELEEFDIAALTKEVVESFSEKFEREGNIVKTDIQPAAVGKWDKVRIEQAVTNLLSNAIKYGNKKPIEVVLTNHIASAKLSIRDHGIGIPKEQQEKIFALFERGGRSSQYKGLGVGLYITNEIIKAHHGRIDVESRENKGSTFTIELPLKPPPHN